MMLVDTDVLVDLMRGNSQVGRVLDEPASDGPLAASIVTRMELIVGCRDKTELAGLADLLDRFEVVPINEPASQQDAALLEQFRLSHGLLIPDALIAATALTFGYSLMTKNRRHFSFVPGLQLVPLSDTI